MKRFFTGAIIFASLCLNSARAESASQPKNLHDFCHTWLKQLPGQISEENLTKLCIAVKSNETCVSQTKQYPIFHFDKIGSSKAGKKILVFAQFHGDETPAGAAARYWMERLLTIETRNTWRIIPFINPEGLELKTRTNARGVDLNRNLPTKNWETEAKERWSKIEKNNPRRFPGEKSSSESEVKCVLDQISEFNPDFVLSLHSPYGLLDFDGPESYKIPTKKFKDLPWRRLGNYPGSLGRYLWAERNVPVLTVELKGNDFYQDQKYLEDLQDSLGSFAIQMLTVFNKKGMISSASKELEESIHAQRIPADKIRKNSRVEN